MRHPNETGEGMRDATEAMATSGDAAAPAGLARRIAHILYHPAPRMFLVLQLADIATTLIGLAVGANELNGVAVLFFAQFGTTLGLVVLKLLGAVLVIALFVRAQLRRPKWWGHWVILHLGNVFYAVVVINNLQVITDLTRSVIVNMLLPH